MVEVVAIDEAEEPDDDFAVMVEPESEARHLVVEFDRRHARFIYGPRTFASRQEALDNACHWADQYGMPKVYVH